MTRRRWAMLFAAILAVLYAYEIVSAIAGGVALNRLHFLGLGCAVGLLVVETRAGQKDS